MKTRLFAASVDDVHDQMSSKQVAKLRTTLLGGIVPLFAILVVSAIVWASVSKRWWKDHDAKNVFIAETIFRDCEAFLKLNEVAPECLSELTLYLKGEPITETVPNDSFGNALRYSFRETKCSREYTLVSGGLDAEFGNEDDALHWKRVGRGTCTRPEFTSLFD